MTINVKPISLMVVASIPEGKAAIQNFLSELKNVDIVGLAYNKRSAIQQLKSIQPDVLLIDVMLLRLHSIDIISYVFSIQSDVKILALSPGDPSHDRIILAVQAGALGYVSWDANPAEISAAIQKVFHGEYYLPLEATYEILQEVAPELKIFAEERRTKIFETLLGLIPLFGVLSASNSHFKIS
ncbi:MAG: response regulator [Xenococcus sp. MO_188.B8]|nr:response regulator [Xenococcus sp. MO_188.B8]